MADYPSIESKVEDAVYYAFGTFTGGPTGYTYFKSNTGDELTLPAITIQCQGFKKIHETAEEGARNNYAATVIVATITNATETSRTVHGNLYGWAQAMGIQSAPQMVGLMNAAGVSNFTASVWAEDVQGETNFEDDLRISTLTFSLICSGV